MAWFDGLQRRNRFVSLPGTDLANGAVVAGFLVHGFESIAKVTQSSRYIGLVDGTGTALDGCGFKQGHGFAKTIELAQSRPQVVLGFCRFGIQDHRLLKTILGFG